MIEYVDVATARVARGTRIVTSGLVPSPWSEAVKGLFRIAGLPVVAVRRMRDASEVTAWTGVDNVPVVMHDDEPPRTSWSAIVGLVARLAGPDAIVPDEPAARAAAFGLLELIAGEGGLGWNGRLAMIDASLESSGARGFPLPVATYLAKRYGHAKLEPARLRARVAAQLRVVDDQLAAQRAHGHVFLGGSRVSALDVYAATFLTPLTAIDEAACPQMIEPLRRAFATAHEAFAELVPATLWAHRSMMFERHLGWPIAL